MQYFDENERLTEQQAKIRAKVLNLECLGMTRLAMDNFRNRQINSEKDVEDYKTARALHHELGKKRQETLRRAFAETDPERRALLLKLAEVQRAKPADDVPDGIRLTGRPIGRSPF